MSDSEEKVRVIVRIRPLQSSEEAKGHISAVKPIVTEKGQEVEVKLNSRESQFINCNGVFPIQTTQSEFFANSGITSLLESAVEGYRTCAFAFGQTGAGKTFTVAGPDRHICFNDESGLLGRSLEYVFNRVATIQPHYVIRISCIEIYQEQVYDLLQTTSITKVSLPVREHKRDGFFIEGIQIVPCTELRAACKVVDIALRGRQTGHNEINSRSSRSHFLTDIFVELPGRKDRLQGGYVEADDAPDGNYPDEREYTTMGRITLVDLAGSERLKNTKAKGKALTETGFINKSLYVLGKVIAGLVRTRGDVTNSRDVPFRDSKLTKLMINSLGGNGKTMLVACVSECSVHLAETLRTLKFSTSCARIKNRPVRQFNPQQRLIMELRNEIHSLQMENGRLKEHLTTGPSDTASQFFQSGSSSQNSLGDDSSLDSMAGPGGGGGGPQTQPMHGGTGSQSTPAMPPSRFDEQHRERVVIEKINKLSQEEYSRNAAMGLSPPKATKFQLMEQERLKHERRLKKNLLVPVRRSREHKSSSASSAVRKPPAGQSRSAANIAPMDRDCFDYEPKTNAAINPFDVGKPKRTPGHASGYGHGRARRGDDEESLGGGSMASRQSRSNVSVVSRTSKNSRSGASVATKHSLDNYSDGPEETDPVRKKAAKPSPYITHMTRDQKRKHKAQVIGGGGADPDEDDEPANPGEVVSPMGVRGPAKDPRSFVPRKKPVVKISGLLPHVANSGTISSPNPVQHSARPITESIALPDIHTSADPKAKQQPLPRKVASAKASSPPPRKAAPASSQAVSSPLARKVQEKLQALEVELQEQRRDMEDDPGSVTAEQEESFKEMVVEAKAMRRMLAMAEPEEDDYGDEGYEDDAEEAAVNSRVPSTRRQEAAKPVPAKPKPVAAKPKPVVAAKPAPVPVAKPAPAAHGKGVSGKKATMLSDEDEDDLFASLEAKALPKDHGKPGARGAKTGAKSGAKTGAKSGAKAGGGPTINPRSAPKADAKSSLGSPDPELDPDLEAVSGLELALGKRLSDNVDILVADAECKAEDDDDGYGGEEFSSSVDDQENSIQMGLERAKKAAKAEEEAAAKKKAEEEAAAKKKAEEEAAVKKKAEEEAEEDDYGDDDYEDEEFHDAESRAATSHQAKREAEEKEAAEAAAAEAKREADERAAAAAAAEAKRDAEEKEAAEAAAAEAKREAEERAAAAAAKAKRDADEKEAEVVAQEAARAETGHVKIEAEEGEWESSMDNAADKPPTANLDASDDYGDEDFDFQDEDEDEDFKAKLQQHQ